MIEFVSNLSLDNCVRRLENQSEGFSLFSFRWQTRLVVHVKPVDQFTCKFVLKRVGKSSLWSWGGVSRVEGFLKAQTPHSTVVIAQAHYNWFTIMFSWLMMVVVAALFYWTWTEDGIIRNDNRLLYISVLFLGAMVINGLTFLWAYFQNDSMLNRIKRVLGDYSNLG